MMTVPGGSPDQASESATPHSEMRVVALQDGAPGSRSGCGIWR
jgi:hypothetical protein